jgi:7-carboxy-7-deazaguanine synthase
MILKDDKLKINEIYYTLSGEGKTSGTRIIVIRTTGCNLRCNYNGKGFCDTPYAYNQGKEMSINDILNQVKKYNCKNILLSGGEPLLDPTSFVLVEKLYNNGYFILIETNGSIPIQKYLAYVTFSMDIKCPSTGMTEKMCWINLKDIRQDDEVKFVIANKNDYNFAKKIITNFNIKGSILFSPVWEKLNPKDLAKWILKDNLNVKLSLQIHKIIWGNKRGV